VKIGGHADFGAAGARRPSRGAVDANRQRCYNHADEWLGHSIPPGGCLMHRQVLCNWALAPVLAVTVTAGATVADAQESKSATPVKEFVQLAGPDMRYVAAKLPDKPDEYVAALHIPGVQLLVITARYEQPSFLNEMLAKGDHQGVYTDLNSASYTVAATRVFFEDLRADGLHPRREDENAAFDMYEKSGKRVMFDGDFRKQKMEEQAYLDAFTAADQAYARAVTLLNAVLKKKGS
jgi:hypothetical protein